jgi:hypothetical protein
LLPSCVGSPRSKRDVFGSMLVASSRPCCAFSTSSTSTGVSFTVVSGASGMPRIELAGSRLIVDC